MAGDQPHAPKLDYLCDDPDCCYNGCPHVWCRSCGEDWPCSEWCGRHTEAQVLAQFRYAARKRFPGDIGMVEYAAINDFNRWKRLSQESV